MIPKSTRWNRNHTKISEYHFKWEIDIMKKPEFIYDIEIMMKPITVPDLQLHIPDGHFTRGGTDMDHTLHSMETVKN